MEDVDRYRIRTNLVELIKETHYDSLVDSIERIDKEKVVPPRLLADWKNRRTKGWPNKKLNSTFYDEIQRRGPHAFQLLVDSLLNSAHQNQNLAVLLDPTLRRTESESEEVPSKGYYSDEGTHYVYIDDSWQAETCLHDRQALQQFFEEQGYTRFNDFSEVEDCADDIGSLVVVNFCSLSQGGITRENDWVYEKFNKACLEKKPKILFSLRYIGGKPKKVVEQDSGKILELFRDTLQVKISLDATKKKEGEKSEEVMHLLNILSADNHMYLEDKLRKLQGEFKKHKLYPLEWQDTYFCKAFSVTKNKNAVT